MTKHMRRLVGLLLLAALLPAPAMADKGTFLREARRAIGAFFKDQGLTGRGKTHGFECW